MGNSDTMDLDKKSVVDDYGATAHVETPDETGIDKINSAIADYDDSIEKVKPSRAVWLITFTVATGGFLFGELCPRYLVPALKMTWKLT